MKKVKVVLVTLFKKKKNVLNKNNVFMVLNDLW